ncbi:endonuclease MutS2 [Geobacter argillaceus]|uniref:Endonuclease MutS2 n=1 Tax=Geobacter argillaceus TaxID=345631 RepID=A0A562VEX5_9BACT|nr:endonuclease MutS2 [Geobacter argillaceus]TWJ16430.1 DNA mismatch repair protein MutS2 [Geobacter argillaceus]
MSLETLRILEFDRILAWLATFAHCPATVAAIEEIRPFAGRWEIEERLGLVEEVRRLARFDTGLPLAGFEDVEPVLDLARPDGAVLNPVDLAVLLPLLRVGAAVARQLASRNDLPLLTALAGQLTGCPEILEALENSLDSEGGLLDSASRALFDLRTRKRQLTARIRKRLEEIVRERQTAIFLQDDFITQRNGRWVIPVRMDSKGMVPGVVHDVSNTGETAFMEPLEIIGLANELENLVAEEKGEMIRILRQLTGWVREESERISEEFRVVVALDLLASLARGADLLGAEAPEITEEPRLMVRDGRHPLLVLLQRERGGQNVVPLDLTLGGSSDGAPDRVMLITGPNTGGKTIAIKTVGLLLLMAQAGMPVPAAATSVFPVTSDLLADIGDEQSIQESLSTFSAHIRTISRILERADNRTVVLLDELGTGTDPNQGAAIACAVLEELHRRGSMVLATTHLIDIVAHVQRVPGMVNAAMEFDARTFTPLYRLKSGEPGQSHALATARRYGLPESVIERAEGMVGRLEAEFHDLLTDLKGQRQRHEALLADLERRERELVQQETLLAERRTEAERRLRESREKGLHEARELVSAARREINAILEEARRERSRTSRERLTAMEEQLTEQMQALHPEETLSLDRVREGDTVFVRPLGYDVTVLSVDRKQKRLRVRAGQLELAVAAADIAPSQRRDAPARERRRTAEAPAELPSDLNIIGQRVDAALAHVEKFLDQAALQGRGEVRIIHGKGTGALMRAVREILERHPLVEGARPGEAFEGGDGVTVVILR